MIRPNGHDGTHLQRLLRRTRLGLSRAKWGTPVKEILTVYGVLFLLAIPLLRVRPTILATAAGITALHGPLVSFALRRTVVTRYRPGSTPSFQEFASAHGLLEIAKELLFKAHPRC